MHALRAIHQRHSALRHTFPCLQVWPTEAYAPLWRELKALADQGAPTIVHRRLPVRAGGARACMRSSPSRTQQPPKTAAAAAAVMQGAWPVSCHAGGMGRVLMRSRAPVCGALHLQVLPNAFQGIAGGYEVEVLFVVLGGNEAWEARLPNATQVSRDAAWRGAC